MPLEWNSVAHVMILAYLWFSLWQKTPFTLTKTFPHSTNKALPVSGDAKVNDLVTLTVTFILRIASLDFVATRATSVLFHKTILPLWNGNYDHIYVDILEHGHIYISYVY